MELEMIVILNILVSGMNRKFEGYWLAWEFRLGCGYEAHWMEGLFWNSYGIGLETY
jgi:hypothetical protein